MSDRRECCDEERKNEEKLSLRKEKAAHDFFFPEIIYFYFLGRLLGSLTLRKNIEELLKDVLI